jgi:hypothetical protein
MREHPFSIFWSTVYLVSIKKRKTKNQGQSAGNKDEILFSSSETTREAITLNDKFKG